MADLLGDSIEHKTTLSAGFLEHAAYQSMEVYLADWEWAHARLGRQIEKLRAARDERQKATESGAWPPPREPSGSGDQGGQP